MSLENMHTHQQKLATPAPIGAILQRKCACGNHTVAGGECAECRKKRLQRKATNHSEPETVPSIVHEVLRSPGQPLDPATRTFMEPRFGRDFSRVRVHTDGKANESAQVVNALAYTVGQDIVFGAKQYAPETTVGRQLMAHELTHVVQQVTASLQSTSLGSNSENNSAEHEANVTAKQIDSEYKQQPKTVLSAPLLQRKMIVDKPADMIPNPTGKGVVQNNATTVQNYLTTLCSGGSVSVNNKSGDVNINASFCTRPQATFFGYDLPWTTESPAEKSKTATGCGCICDMVNSTHLWKIQVDDSSWPHTVFNDDDAANGKKPGGTGGVVTTPSPNSPKLWGAGTASGKTLDIDPWLVLGHELCGHGWLGNSGKHGPDETQARGEGGHQETVARENALRKEHGIELRATFKEPNCGESYWRDKSAPGKVNWSSYRTVCQNWRDAYNKKHGTKYTIADKLP